MSAALKDSAPSPEIGRLVVASGLRTNVHDIGSGAPVLMIHGSGPGVSAWSNWRLNMPVLAEQRRVIAMDCAGFGYTEPFPDHRYTGERWLSHIVAVLDELGLEQVDVVGNSFGGSMALGLALHHPSRVRRLVLMGSVGIRFELTPGLDTVWGYENTVEGMRRVLDVFAYNRNLITDELAALRYRAASRPGIAEAYADMFPAPRQRWIDTLAHDETALANLAHQVLIVHGREDLVIPPSNARKLFDIIPNAQLHMFGHCGHWSQIEHRDRFNTLVGSFLSN